MVLGLSIAGMILAFAVANVAVFNLHFSTGVDSRAHARNLAEGVINLAIGKVVEAYENNGLEYGYSRDVADDVSFAGVGYPGEGQGFLSFNQASAAGHSVHYSTNNPGFNPLPGDGRSVPPHSLHLVGFGQCGDIKVQLECIYHRPPFPKGLCATGKARLRAVTLLGLAPGASFNGDWSTVPESDQIPANVFSCSGADDAMLLDSNCSVSGGVGSCGGIQIDPAAQVRGEVRAHAAIQQVPSLDPPAMLTRIAGTLGLVPFDPTQTLGDFALVTGDLSLANDLVLEGGVLGVTGNLTMTNNAVVRGRGAVIVGGDAILLGSALEAGRQCALAAQGQITLTGSDRATHYFQGLVYSGTKIVASGVTVVGAMVCHNDVTGQGDVFLDNARVIQCPVHLAGRWGVPLVREVGLSQPTTLPGEPDGADSVIFNFYTIPDPQRQGQFLYFGHARYSMSRLNAQGVPTIGPNSGVEVRWVPNHSDVFAPGSSTWTMVHGATDYDVCIPMGTRSYDGTLATLTADMNSLLDCDTSNPHVYFGEISAALASYTAALAGRKRAPDYLDFNLNRVMTPGEDSRILFLREI